MQKYYCDICGGELPADYQRRSKERDSVAAICAVDDTCPSCAYIEQELNPAEILGREWRRIAKEKQAERGSANFRGKGGQEKREIYDRLTAYRAQYGLGALEQLAKQTGITATALRMMLDGEAKPLEVWRSVGSALGKIELEHGK